METRSGERAFTHRLANLKSFILENHRGDNVGWIEKRGVTTCMYF